MQDTSMCNSSSDCVQAQWATLTTQEEELQVHSSSCSQGMGNMGQLVPPKTMESLPPALVQQFWMGVSWQTKQFCVWSQENLLVFPGKCPWLFYAANHASCQEFTSKILTCRKLSASLHQLWHPWCLFESSPDQRRGATNRKPWSKAESSPHFDAGPCISPLCDVKVNLAVTYRASPLVVPPASSLCRWITAQHESCLHLVP